MNNPTSFIERPLTEQERSISLWLLQHGSQEASTFLSDVDRVTVVGTCPCGCDTVDFAVSGCRPANSGMHVLSDYYWVDDDGHTNGIFIYAISGQLAGLEVYSCDGECGSVRLPDPTRLAQMPQAQGGG